MNTATINRLTRILTDQDMDADERAYWTAELEAAKLDEYNELVARYKDMWSCNEKVALRRKIGKINFQLRQEGILR